MKPGRILMVTRNFPPLTGGMERLLYHSFLELHARGVVDLVGPGGCEQHVPGGVQVRGVALSPLVRFLGGCYWHARGLARAGRPSLVLSGSGLTALPALLVGLETGTPVVTFVHGLDLVVESPVYRTVFLPAIRRCAGVIVNSRNTARLASEAGVDPARIRLLHPGVALPDETRRPDGAAFRVGQRIGEGDSILLSVGRLSPRKGLAEFVSRVMPRVIREEPRCRLVVVGGNPSDGLLKAGDERARIERAAQRAGVGARVTFLGVVSDEVLSQAYAAASLLVFPILELPGDVEGFGMVAVEAAAHGLPTVAFAAGGVGDAVADGVSGSLLSPGDYGGFGAAILEQLAGDREAWRLRCRDFAAGFSWTHFGQALSGLCEEFARR